MNSLFRWALLLLSLFGGCYRVQIKGYGYKKPSNVALYVQIDGRRLFSPQPVSGLDANKFRIEEDGKPVTVQESRQIIMNQQAGAVHYTMLLLDLSGSMARTEQAKTLARAAASFSEQISDIQRVGIYAFDGSPKIKALVPFTSDKAQLKAHIQDILTYKPSDVSTNLYGAVIDGLNTLKEYRDKPGNPKLSFATLVVFTDGSDLASRVSKAELKEEIKKATKYAKKDDKYIHIFAVGLGDKINRSTLRMIGKEDHFPTNQEQELTSKFAKVANLIEKSSQRYYLFSYCSPARNGEHKLTVKVNDGGLRRGRTSYTFNADGFTPNCDPNDIPELLRPKDVEAEKKANAEAAAQQGQEQKKAKLEKKKQTKLEAKQERERKKAEKKAAKESAKGGK